MRSREFAELLAEIGRTRPVAAGEADMVQFLDELDSLIRYAASRGKSVIADAD